MYVKKITAIAITDTYRYNQYKLLKVIKIPANYLVCLELDFSKLVLYITLTQSVEIKTNCFVEKIEFS